MNSIFTHLNNIIHYKRDDALIDHDNGYNAFMVNRWLSMYSPNTAFIINHTANTFYQIFNTKREHYRFVLNIIPKSKIYRINYVKKKKSEKDDDSEIIKFLAKQLELSEREIKYYKETNNIDLSKYKHLCSNKNNM